MLQRDVWASIVQYKIFVGNDVLEVALNKDSWSQMIDLHRLIKLTIKSPIEVHTRKGTEARKMGAGEIIGVIIVFLTCPVRKNNFVKPTWYISGRILNWCNIATETLSGSCDATWSNKRKPYLMQDSIDERVRNQAYWEINIKQNISDNTPPYLLANFWWDILVGNPDLDIRTTSKTPQHLNCCNTSPCSYFPGDWKLLGLIQRMKCGVVFSSRCISWNNCP